MQLDEFIQSTINSIGKGVNAAREDMENLGGLVNPMEVNGVASFVTSETVIQRPSPQNIKFEIAVQVTEDKASSSNVGANLKVLSFSKDHKSKGLEASTHKISFEVPVVLPSSNIEN